MTVEVTNDGAEASTAAAETRGEATVEDGEPTESTSMLSIGDPDAVDGGEAPQAMFEELEAAEAAGRAGADHDGPPAEQDPSDADEFSGGAYELHLE
jgi:hypothetical protein